MLWRCISVCIKLYALHRISVLYSTLHCHKKLRRRERHCLPIHNNSLHVRQQQDGHTTLCCFLRILLGSNSLCKSNTAGSFTCSVIYISQEARLASSSFPSILSTPSNAADGRTRIHEGSGFFEQISMSVDALSNITPETFGILPHKPCSLNNTVIIAICPPDEFPIRKICSVSI